MWIPQQNGLVFHLVKEGQPQFIFTNVEGKTRKMLQEISFIDQHHNFKHNFFPLAHVYTISIHMSKKQQMYINVIKRTMLIDKHYSGETNAEDKGVYNINRTQTIAV